MHPKGTVSASSFLNLQSEYLAERSKHASIKDRQRTASKAERAVAPKRSAPEDNDEAEWIKCRDALERKARLYDRAKRGGSDNDHHGQPVYSSAGLSSGSVGGGEKESSRDFESVLLGAEPVEVVDEFGRTRKVNSGDTLHNDEAPANSQELHYAVEADIRSVGLGFYKFSAFDRAAQMRDLNVLRQATVAGRHSHAELIRRRREYMQHRLEIARERKNRLSSL